MLETAIVISIISGVVIIVSLLIRAVYASKCTDIRCGCIEIKRDVTKEPSLSHLTVK